jgi:hypothetical protein
MAILTALKEKLRTFFEGFRSDLADSARQWWDFSQEVCVQIKKIRVLAIAHALTLTLTLFQYPEGELNPHSIAATGV